jgi:hypothetical protein
MAVTGVTTQPQVVKLGGAVEERYAYVDGEAFVAGDLIRISSAGEVKVAEINTAGAVHGIALETVAAEVNELAPVLLFAPDTIVRIQTIDGESPADLSKGSSYTLEKGTGVWAVTATTTNGIALVVDYADTGTPWDDRYASFDQDSTVDNNAVDVRFTAATLDAHVA